MAHLSVTFRLRSGHGCVPVLSALSDTPVFFVGEEEEVPDWVAPSAAVAIVLAIVALALIYAARREAAPSSR